MQTDIRPHGTHPHLGRCDCDECQAFDAAAPLVRPDLLTQARAALRKLRGEPVTVGFDELPIPEYGLYLTGSLTVRVIDHGEGDFEILDDTADLDASVSGGEGLPDEMQVDGAALVLDWLRDKIDDKARGF